VPIITVVVAPIIMVVVVVASILAADVMAVNPVAAVVGPMARDPNHFPVACPITGAMAVIWPVAYLNAEALSADSGCRKKNAGRNQGDDQEFVLNHILLIRLARAKRVLCGIKIVLSSWGQATARRQVEAHETEKPPRIGSWRRSVG
jgi:hypothetical protein